MITLSEQVRELEGRLDAAVLRAVKAERQIPALLDGVTAAESRLAQARVEGAREALTKLSAEVWTHGISSPESFDIRVMRFRDREYPAVPEGGERHCGCWADRAPSEPCVCPRIGEQWAVRAWHCDTCKRGGTGSVLCGKQECNATRNAFPDHPTPTPEREGYEGPIVALSLTEMSDGGEKLLITPALARRIVSLAAQDGGSV